jgi:NodT family efflux transporter outer membrane factor (OMF) lipoprotein
MKGPTRLVLFWPSLLLAACSFAPRYQEPSTPPPPPVYQESGEWQMAQPADASKRDAWWALYQDPELNELEAKIALANQDLKAALARLEQARAQTRIARSAEFPTITAGPTITRSRTSRDAPDYNPNLPIVHNDFLAEGDLSYEIDLWGKIRNSVSAARAGAQASAADAAALELALHAELATDYFQLRNLDAQRALLDHTVEAYARGLELTQHLYDGGAAPISDLLQAKAQLEGAKTQQADISLRRSQTQHGIAVLVGESASTFRLDAKPLPTDAQPPALDAGMPSTLVERRPDVAAAERRVAQANANIGVARAAYFPVFSLGAAAGFESLQSSNWFSAPSRLWSIGPSAVLTVFDGGLHRAQSAQAHAAYDEQVADYRGVVLGAFQDVEDNLAALRQLQSESTSEAAAVEAAKGALDQANDRYQGGLVTYLEVVTAETTALQAELSAADIQQRRLAASIALIKALGGGWERAR